MLCMMDREMKKRLINWMVGYDRFHGGEYDETDVEFLNELANQAHDIFYDMREGEGDGE